MENKIRIFTHEIHGSIPVIHAGGKAWFEYMVLLEMVGFKDLSLEPHRFQGNSSSVRVFDIPSPDIPRKAVFVDSEIASYLVRNFYGGDVKRLEEWLLEEVAREGDDVSREEIEDLKFQVAGLEARINLLFNKLNNLT